jgi:hypothetical protein
MYRNVQFVFSFFCFLRGEEGEERKRRRGEGGGEERGGEVEYIFFDT